MIFNTHLLLKRFLLVATCLWLVHCGTWVGNPEGDGDDDGSGTPQVAGGGGGSNSQQNIALPGDVFMQKLRLKGGVPVKAVPKFKGAALLGQVATSGFPLANNVAATGPLEISVAAPDGREISYQRSALDQVTAESTPDGDGNYTVLIKNNSGRAVELESLGVDGGTLEGTPELGHKRSQLPTQNILIKGVVALARTCKAFNADGSKIVEVKAEEGSYFAQPFIFIGKVGPDKKVTDLSKAQVSLSLGSQEQKLSALGDLPLSALKDYELPRDYAVVRQFYQGYFGAAGELYTTDTFMFGGDCSKAVSFKLNTDVGTSLLTLAIKDSSQTPAIDVRFSLRPSLGAPFSMYTATSEKLVDYTQCTINPLTAKSSTYNGDAASCKQFRLSDPPYVQLDYKLPSETNPALSKESNPNRILFYGHGRPTGWHTQILEKASEIISGSVTSLVLPGCLNHGGLIAVPLVPKKTLMPLSEFNAVENDVINLASRPGTFTSALDYYQGNVDLSGTVSLKACVPSGGASCGEQRTISVQLTQCQVKADSGIAVLSVGDSFIYPSYFTMSGVIGP